ncbi:DUF2690 domain-containing protein [Kitasatospora sp. NPDC057015]|uniref:DUF2690 domain-containing protein n=1 Tax=Kitasatospora sp. NPDC057015 TaxID=3346001 RepID=UPI00362D0CB5
MTMTTEDSLTTPPPGAAGTGPDAAERLRLELLAFKDASGLSYAKIGARTHYAKSSWERWVNGKQFPPRGAVESLATAFQYEVAPLLDLWELADRDRAERELAAAGAGGTVVPEGGDGPDAPERAADGDAPAPAGRASRWSTRRAVLGGVLAAALALAVVLGVSQWGGSPGKASAGGATATVTAGAPAAATASPSASTSASAGAAPATPRPIGCTAAGCNGKDPSTMGCSQDGQTLATGQNQGIVMELRYSKACSAVWGRITYAAPNAVVSAENSDGITSPYAVKWGNDAYSPMVELTAGKEAWTCSTQPDGATRVCTSHVGAPAAP